MSIRKREWTTPSGETKTAWLVDYKDQKGKRRARQFLRKRDADEFRVRAEGEIASGIHTADRASITVAQAADLWIAKADLRKRDRGTLKAYRELRDLHIVPLIGDQKLSRLTTPDVVTFRDTLLETRSPAMVRKAVRGLSMILNVAMERGKVAQNVAAPVKVEISGRDRKNKIVIPPREHLKALLEAADRLEHEDSRLSVLVRIAILAGLRSSELRGLSWADVDLHCQTITVAQRADRWSDLGAPKSDAGRRTVPIGPSLAKALRKWKLRCPPSPGGLVLPNRRGKPMSQHRIIERFLAVQVEAELSLADGKARYGLHCLRHAAASAWIKQGIDLKRLQVWIGHATIQLTIDTYGHLITDAQADAALVGGAEAVLFA